MVRLLLQHAQNNKPSYPCRDSNDVTLGSSAIFETRIPKETQDKSRKRSEPDVVRSVAFRPHLSMGLALSESNLDLPTEYRHLVRSKAGSF